MDRKPCSEETKRKISESLKGKMKGKNNPMYGKHHSHETKLKMSEAAKNRPKFSLEHRRKMSESGKGRVFSDEHRRNMSKAATGRILSEETKRKIGEASKGRIHTEESKLKMSQKGKDNPMYGRTHSEESKRKMREVKLGIKNPMYNHTGELNPAWKGGSSFEPYCPKFNESLKRKIRERDGYTCQYCGDPGKHVHHIDHNKKNSNPSNLITLCLPHNTKAEYNPTLWEHLFRNILTYRMHSNWAHQIL